MKMKDFAGTLGTFPGQSGLSEDNKDFQRIKRTNGPFC